MDMVLEGLLCSTSKCYYDYLGGLVIMALLQLMSWRMLLLICAAETQYNQGMQVTQSALVLAGKLLLRVPVSARFRQVAPHALGT